VTERRRLGTILTTRRLAISALLAVAAGALFASQAAHHDVKTSAAYPSGIATVYPKPGTPSVERQTVVFVELQPGFDGTLAINGRVIPDDQIDRLSTGNSRLAFSPGPGKEFSQLPPDRNCVVLSYFHTGQTPEKASQYSWCFNLG
jgi:hypothetical protein